MILKYGNRITEIDGIKFHSRKEAKRYGELKLLERAGEITNLERQVRYPLPVNGILICSYVADFTYSNINGFTVEDTKGFITPEFRIKEKLMRAIHNIEIKLT